MNPDCKLATLLSQRAATDRAAAVALDIVGDVRAHGAVGLDVELLLDLLVELDSFGDGPSLLAYLHADRDSCAVCRGLDDRRVARGD